MKLSPWAYRPSIVSSAVVAGALFVLPASASARPERTRDHERASASAKTESAAPVSRSTAERGGPERVAAHEERGSQAAQVERSTRQRPLPPMLRPEPPRSTTGHTQQKLRIVRGTRVAVPELDGRAMAQAFALLAGGVMLLHSVRTQRRTSGS